MQPRPPAAGRLTCGWKKKSNEMRNQSREREVNASSARKLHNLGPTQEINAPHDESAALNYTNRTIQIGTVLQTAPVRT